jgi:hypothetical protein
MKIKTLPIFSGENSIDLWDAINNAKSKKDLRDALYFLACRIQALEARVRREVEP